LAGDRDNSVQAAAPPPLIQWQYQHL